MAKHLVCVLAGHITFRHFKTFLIESPLTLAAKIWVLLEASGILGVFRDHSLVRNSLTSTLFKTV